jgi:hypothetical protein
MAFDGTRGLGRQRPRSVRSMRQISDPLRAVGGARSNVQSASRRFAPLAGPLVGTFGIGFGSVSDFGSRDRGTKKNAAQNLGNAIDGLRRPFRRSSAIYGHRNPSGGAGIGVVFFASCQRDVLKSCEFNDSVSAHGGQVFTIQFQC